MQRQNASPLQLPLEQRLNSCGEIPGCDRGAREHCIAQLFEPANRRLFDHGFGEGQGYRPLIIL